MGEGVIPRFEVGSKFEIQAKVLANNSAALGCGCAMDCNALIIILEPGLKNPENPRALLEPSG